MKQEIDERLQLAAEEYADKYTITNTRIKDIRENYILSAFIAGAQWQRNHVWHDISEKPTEPKATTMIDNKYWCYLEDIIPTNK